MVKLYDLNSKLWCFVGEEKEQETPRQRWQSEMECRLLRLLCNIHLCRVDGHLWSSSSKQQHWTDIVSKCCPSLNCYGIGHCEPLLHDNRKSNFVPGAFPADSKRWLLSYHLQLRDINQKLMIKPGKGTHSFHLLFMFKYGFAFLVSTVLLPL